MLMLPPNGEELLRSFVLEACQSLAYALSHAAQKLSRRRIRLFDRHHSKAARIVITIYVALQHRYPIGKTLFVVSCGVTAVDWLPQRRGRASPCPMPRSSLPPDEARAPPERSNAQAICRDRRARRYWPAASRRYLDHPSASMRCSRSSTPTTGRCMKRRRRTAFAQTACPRGRAAITGSNRCWRGWKPLQARRPGKVLIHDAARPFVAAPRSSTG